MFSTNPEPLNPEQMKCSEVQKYLVPTLNY